LIPFFLFFPFQVIGITQPNITVGPYVDGTQCFQDAFNQCSGGIGVEDDIVIDARSGRRIQTVSVPVRGYNNRVVGVLSFQLYAPSVKFYDMGSIIIAAYVVTGLISLAIVLLMVFLHTNRKHYVLQTTTTWIHYVTMCAGGLLVNAAAFWLASVPHSDFHCGIRKQLLPLAIGIMYAPLLNEISRARSIFKYLREHMYQVGSSTFASVNNDLLCLCYLTLTLFPFSLRSFPDQGMTSVSMPDGGRDSMSLLRGTFIIILPQVILFIISAFVEEMQTETMTTSTFAGRQGLEDEDGSG
jgi:hypothetical protein